MATASAGFNAFPQQQQQMVSILMNKDPQRSYKSTRNGVNRSMSEEFFSASFFKFLLVDVVEL